jgi:hypothetical protein
MRSHTLSRRRPILWTRSRSGIGRAWICRRRLVRRTCGLGGRCAVDRGVSGCCCIRGLLRHPTKPVSMPSRKQLPTCMTYKRCDQRWWLVPLYTRRIIEHRRYHRQSAERAEQGPKRSQYVSDILTRFLSEPQKSGHRRG